MSSPLPPRVFTGNETASEILRVVLLEDFIPEIRGADAQITYMDDIPYLSFRAKAKNHLGDFYCNYKLDRMMETVFPECERLYDEAQSVGLVGDDEYAQRAVTIRHLVRFAMNQMLHRLLLLQLIMFQENFDETMFMTSGMLIYALTKDPQSAMKKEAMVGVKNCSMKQSSWRLAENEAC